MIKTIRFLLAFALLISTSVFAANLPEFSTTVPSQTTVGAVLSGKTITLTNNLPFALTGLSSSVSGSSGLGWTTSSNTCSGTLAVGASCVLTGDISPTAAGDLKLTYTINASNSRPLKKTIPVTVGAAPTLTASTLTSPTSIGTSQDLTFTYTNNATNMSITLSSETLNETSGVSWVETDDACLGQTIAAGATCTITGTYTPSASGTQSVTLTLGADNIKTATATASATVNTSTLYLAAGALVNASSQVQPLLYSSTDGETWTNSSANLSEFTNKFLQTIVWTGSSWVGVGSEGQSPSLSPIALSSTDGTSWTQETLPSGVGTSSASLFISGISNANDITIASGYYGATSDLDDAKMLLLKRTSSGTWSNVAPNDDTGYSLNEVVYGNNFWLAAGRNEISGQSSPYLLKSNADATSWTQVTPMASNLLIDSIAYNANASGAVKSVMCALSESEGVGVAIYSSDADALTWTSRTLTPAISEGAGLDCPTITYANNQWVAAGAVKATESSGWKIFILTSSDGTSWTSEQLSTEYAGVSVGRVYWDGSKWILVASVTPVGSSIAQSLILLSTDASTWTSATSVPTSTTTASISDMDKGEG